LTKIKNLDFHIKTRSEQELRDSLSSHPVIHFTKDARSIFMEGFKYGADIEDVDGTFDTSNTDELGDIIRRKASSGINYAFDTLSYSFENDCLDYEYGIVNGLGMYEETAIMCLADIIKTTHMENFEQCLFYGEDVDLKTMILLKNEGIAVDEDGEPYYDDDSGEEYEKWSAYSKVEGHLVRSDENLSLEETISQSLKKMIEANRYPKKLINDVNELYSDYKDLIERPDGLDKELTLQGAKRIANEVRNELNDEEGLQNDFVDYCDVCAEKVEEKLLAEGYDCEIKNEFYLHKFEDTELDTYSHHWIECNGIIIDPSRSQFDSTEYAQRKSLSKNHTDNNEVPKKRKSEQKIKI